MEVGDTGTALDYGVRPRSRGARSRERSSPAIARVNGAPDDLVEARALRTHQWIERDGTRWEPQDADTRPRTPKARAS